MTGQFLSNTGSWMQRIAQDWLVLSLTGSPAAVGIATAMQFAPALGFGLIGGLIADRYPKRRILLMTQVGMASMAATLAYLTLTHQVAVWQVYLIAFGLGMVSAVDNPTRQSFVNEMVGPEKLRNAISINSSAFQLAALIGPPVSGLLIGALGPGYSFAINGLSYLPPITCLLLMRKCELTTPPQVTAKAGQLRDGWRYAMSHPNVLWPTVLVAVFGMFTANLPVTLAAYAKSVFHSGPSGYALLSAIVATGSLTGALISARQRQARLRKLLMFSTILAVLDMVSSAVPGEGGLCIPLLLVGATTLLLFTSANSIVQLAAHDAIRGRIVGLYLLASTSTAAVGGPLLGLADQHFGPRIGMLITGAIPAIATAFVAIKVAGSLSDRPPAATSP